MADASSFTKLVPGFDFLQGLVKNAGSALPSIGQWVAPTLDPEELEKRIDELKTVQFWLEQNARMLAATIQALEVQRMTLTTLRTMNVQMDDLTESLKIRMPEAPPAPAPAPPPSAPPAAAAPAPAPAAEPDGAEAGKPRRKGGKAGSPGAAPGAVDPMQWWGALTRQFADLAAGALQEAGGDAARDQASAAIKKGAQGGKAAAPTPAAKAERPARKAAPRKRAGGTSKNAG